MKVLVFGAGDCGVKYLRENRAGDSVIGFLDNNRKKQGRSLFGEYLCHPPQKVKDLQYDKVVIASSLENLRLQIHKELLSVGVAEETLSIIRMLRKKSLTGERSSSAGFPDTQRNRT